MQISVIEFLFGSRFYQPNYKVYLLLLQNIISRRVYRLQELAFLSRLYLNQIRLRAMSSSVFSKCTLSLILCLEKKKQFYVAASTVVKKNIYFIGTEIYPQKS